MAVSEHVTLSNIKWVEHMCFTLEILQNRGISCDTEIEGSDGSTLKAHACVLAASTPTMQKDLLSQAKGHHKLCFGDIPTQSWHYVIKFIYSGRVVVPASRLENFLKAMQRVEISGFIIRKSEDGQIITGDVMNLEPGMGTLIVENIEWKRTLLRSLVTLQQNCLFCDVVMTAKGGRQVWMHSCVLLAVSHSVWDRLEQRHDEAVYYLRMEAFYKQTLEALVQFMYKGEVEVNPTQLSGLYKASEDLGIDVLKLLSKMHMGQSDNAKSDNPDKSGGDFESVSVENTETNDAVKLSMSVPRTTTDSVAAALLRTSHATESGEPVETLARDMADDRDDRQSDTDSTDSDVHVEQGSSGAHTLPLLEPRPSSSSLISLGSGNQSPGMAALQLQSQLNAESSIQQFFTTRPSVKVEPVSPTSSTPLPSLASFIKQRRQSLPDVLKPQRSPEMPVLKPEIRGVPAKRPDSLFPPRSLKRSLSTPSDKEPLNLTSPTKQRKTFPSIGANKIPEATTPGSLLPKPVFPVTSLSPSSTSGSDQTRYSFAAVDKTEDLISPSLSYMDDKKDGLVSSQTMFLLSQRILNGKSTTPKTDKPEEPDYAHDTVVTEEDLMCLSKHELEVKFDILGLSKECRLQLTRRRIQLRNRVSARQCRSRKLEKIQTLEVEISRLRSMLPADAVQKISNELDKSQPVDDDSDQESSSASTPWVNDFISKLSPEERQAFTMSAIDWEQRVNDPNFPEHLLNRLKLIRRRVFNRLAAQKSRNRRRQKIEKLEVELNRLKAMVKDVCPELYKEATSTLYAKDREESSSGHPIVEDISDSSGAEDDQLDMVATPTGSFSTSASVFADAYNRGNVKYAQRAVEIARSDKTFYNPLTAAKESKAMGFQVKTPSEDKNRNSITLGHSPGLSSVISSRTGGEVSYTDNASRPHHSVIERDRESAESTTMSSSKRDENLTSALSVNIPSSNFVSTPRDLQHYKPEFSFMDTRKMAKPPHDMYRSSQEVCLISPRKEDRPLATAPNPTSAEAIYKSGFEEGVSQVPVESPLEQKLGWYPTDKAPVTHSETLSLKRTLEQSSQVYGGNRRHDLLRNLNYDTKPLHVSSAAEVADGEQVKAAVSASNIPRSAPSKPARPSFLDLEPNAKAYYGAYNSLAVGALVSPSAVQAAAMLHSPLWPGIAAYPYNPLISRSLIASASHHQTAAGHLGAGKPITVQSASQESSQHTVTLQSVDSRLTSSTSPRGGGTPATVTSSDHKLEEEGLTKVASTQASTPSNGQTNNLAKYQKLKQKYRKLIVPKRPAKAPWDLKSEVRKLHQQLQYMNKLHEEAMRLRKQVERLKRERKAYKEQLDQAKSSLAVIQELQKEVSILRYERDLYRQRYEELRSDSCSQIHVSLAQPM